MIQVDSLEYLNAENSFKIWLFFDWLEAAFARSDASATKSDFFRYNILSFLAVLRSQL